MSSEVANNQFLNRNPRQGHSQTDGAHDVEYHEMKEREIQALELAEQRRVQAEFLKSRINEHEQSIHHLKQEISYMGKIDRKREKDVKLLQESLGEAPKLIKTLRKELTSLKLKLRDAQRQNWNSDRLIRSQSELLENLKLELTATQELVRTKDLLAKDELEKQLELERIVSTKQARDIADLNKKLLLLDKNYNAENHSYKAKLARIETECQMLVEARQGLEQTLAEKERHISYLTIYQTGATFKKAAAVALHPCSECEKRKEEAKHTPNSIAAPFIHNVKIQPNAITVEGNISWFGKVPDTAVTLIATICDRENDISFDVTLSNVTLSNNGSFDCNVNTDYTFKSEKNYSIQLSLVPIDSLQTSQKSNIHLVTTDFRPPQPRILAIEVQQTTIFVKFVPTLESTLTAFVQTEEKQVDSQLITPDQAASGRFVLSPCVPGVQYSVYLIGTNNFGQSVPSITVSAHLPEPRQSLPMPLRPLKPIAKVTGSQVQLSITDSSADVESVLVYANSDVTPLVVSSPILQPDGSLLITFDQNHLTMTNPNEDHRIVSAFAIRTLHRDSSNTSTVVSDLSEISDPIAIDYHAAVPLQPDVTILTPTSMRLAFNDRNPLILASHLVALQVSIQQQPDLNLAHRPPPQVERVPLRQRHLMLDPLELGGSYEIRVAYVMRTATGQQVIGPYCRSVHVVLAAILPLPSSPSLPDSSSRIHSGHVNARADATVTIAAVPLRGSSQSLLAAAQRRSLTQLAQNEKIINMHRGLPAEGPVGTVSGSIENMNASHNLQSQSQVRRSHQSSLNTVTSPSIPSTVQNQSNNNTTTNAHNNMPSVSTNSNVTGKVTNNRRNVNGHATTSTTSKQAGAASLPVIKRK